MTFVNPYSRVTFRGRFAPNTLGASSARYQWNQDIYFKKNLIFIFKYFYQILNLLYKCLKEKLMKQH